MALGPHTLAATDRHMRTLGLDAAVADQTAAALDRALTGAVTGTRLDAEISAAAVLGGP